MKGKAVCDNKLVTVAKLLSILANICLTFPTFQNCLSTFTLINSTLLIHYFFQLRFVHSNKTCLVHGHCLQLLQNTSSKVWCFQSYRTSNVICCFLSLPAPAAWGNPSLTGCSSFVWLVFFLPSLTVSARCACTWVYVVAWGWGPGSQAFHTANNTFFFFRHVAL